MKDKVNWEIKDKSMRLCVTGVRVLKNAKAATQLQSSHVFLLEIAFCALSTFAKHTGRKTYILEQKEPSS